MNPLRLLSTKKKEYKSVYFANKNKLALFIIACRLQFI